MFPIGALVWWPCSDLFRESYVCKWICNSRLLGFAPILLINIVASTLWQMNVSSMKLYFGTLVEHDAENSANAECCWRIWKISTSWLAYNSTLRFVKIHSINPGGSGEEAKRAGIQGFWFGGFGLFEFLREQTICSQTLFLEHGYRVAYLLWRDTRCETDTSKLVHVWRSRALSFGGVLNLKSSWKLASSTMRSGGVWRTWAGWFKTKKEWHNGIIRQDKSKLVVETRDQESTRESVTSASADADGWFR